MAAKLLHSLTDDNPDLQKQIGCMTGVFQLFDRHHILAGRRIAGHSPKRLLAGSSYYSSGSLERDSNNLNQRPHLAEKHSIKNLAEKHRVSTESSRASFSSSSRSSSFSSLDCNRITQAEPLSCDPITFPDTPLRDPAISQQSAASQLGRQGLDLRDVVKDSMYREARGLSIKNNKEEGKDRSMKYRDSPRPLQLSKYSDGRFGMDINAKQNLPVDLKESQGCLAKPQEAPWYFDEPRELSRSKSYQLKEWSSFSVSKDAPQFSYDRREINRLSFESRETSKSTQKLEELPRLSLDSRQSSMQSLKPDTPTPNRNPDLKSNILSRNPKGNNVYSFDEGPILPKTLGGLTRPPSVVAKLMGLETFPDSTLNSNLKMGSGSPITRSVEDINSLSSTSKATDLWGPIKMPNSSRSSPREPTSPRWKNPDIVMKPISRFPIEPAPWKQRDGSRSPQKSASRLMKSSAKAHSPFSSVYSEIEKRLKYLEFTQSGKDLRALKQILEAMQNMETRQGGRQDSDFISTPNARFSNQPNSQADQMTSARWGLNSSRGFESPIVIMKPAKLIEKSGTSLVRLDNSFSSRHEHQILGFAENRKIPVHSRVAKDHISKASRKENGTDLTDMKSGGKSTRNAQASSRQQQLSKESTTGSGKRSASVSPRLQQKKLDLDKRSHPPTPPSDSSKPRKQSNKQQSESSSPGGRRRQKYLNVQQSDDQFNEIGIERRKSSYQETQMSLQSDLDIVLKSNIYTEVTSSEISDDIDCMRSPSMKAADVSPCIHKKSTLTLGEDESPAELGVIAPEYPSPVSVLDDAVYVDDAPSPVKHMTETIKADANQSPSNNFAIDQDGVVSDTIGSSITSEINRQKLQNIEHLVQKLRRLNSGHDEARTDYIASLCVENTNPDHRYISEIFLASGLLLRDLGSNLTTFQFHSSGHPINPELFLVLEQTKSSNLLKEECITQQRKPNREKFHRKLIFDTVNEILGVKLVSAGASLEPWSTYKLARKSLNAQKLLRDLCLEIEGLQAKKPGCDRSEEEEDGLKSILWEDVNHRSESWTDYHGEIPVMVLEVERLIFKDLVSEVVISEASGQRLKTKANRRSRQLFAK